MACCSVKLQLVSLRIFNVCEFLLSLFVEKVSESDTEPHKDYHYSKYTEK